MTLSEWIEALGASVLADNLGVSANYLRKICSGARPITDHMLAHAWRRLRGGLDLEGTIRQRRPGLCGDRVTAEIAVVVTLAHRYSLAEDARPPGADSPSTRALSATLLAVVRDTMGDHHGEG